MAFVHLQTAQMLVWMKGYSDINIISHSWGTTLSYDLLNSGGIEMHDWVTMGSPLKSSTDKPVWNTGKWFNYYSMNDPIVYFEMYPPFSSLPSKGLGLPADPNVGMANQRPHNMGKDWWFLEHTAYWKDGYVLGNLRNDLQ